MKKQNWKKVIIMLGAGCLMFLFICMISINKSVDFSFARDYVYAKPPEQVLKSNLVLLPTDQDKAFFDNQSESVENYNEILEAFANSDSSAFALEQKQETKEMEYPDYYGGAYIDENTGGLVVLVKKDTIGLKAAATEIAALTQETTVISSESVETGIRIEACEVSYDELNSAIEFLSEQIDNLHNQGVEVTMIRDDIKNGKVVISILNLTEEKEMQVRSLLDCSFLQFEEGDYEEEEEAIGGGIGITSTDNGGNSTICFAAKRTGRYGFVISGHAGNFLNEQFSYKNIVLGSVGRTACYNGSKADAAFLVANPGITVTNVINQSAVSGGLDKNLPVGTLVYMQGAVSGRQAGKITANNVISEADGITFNNQALASYSSKQGDSGAPILYFSGGKYFICGIHRSDRGDGSNKVFSPFSNIVDELGISFVSSTVRVPSYNYK